MIDNSTIINHVLTLTAHLDAVSVTRIINELNAGTLYLDAGALTVQNLTRLLTADCAELIRVMHEWQNAGGTPAELALAMHTGLLAQKQAQASQPSVELAWTGPIDPKVQARSTRQALEGLIANARESIIILGYSITAGSEPIFQQLVEARRRDVDITIIANRLKPQLELIRSFWPAGVLPPNLYSHEGFETNTTAALHAKVTIIDQQRMFITSANMTYNGLSDNIEVGVIISHLVVKNTVQLIQRLLKTEQIEKLDL